jgi:hypothetical protein
MVTSRDKIAGQQFLWNGGRAQIFGATLTKQNSIQKEIKSRFKSGNTCHHSV